MKSIHLKRTVRLLIAMLLLAVLEPLLFHVAHAENNPSSVQLEYALFRKTSIFDKGSVHICFKNLGKETVKIVDCLINGRSVSSLESDFARAMDNEAVGEPRGWRAYPDNPEQAPVLFHHLIASELAPGDMTQLIVKFAKVPEEPIVIELLTMPGKKLKLKVEPQEPPLSLTFVGFSGRRDMIYLYLRNSGTQSYHIKSIQINGEDAQVIDPSPYQRIEPGTKKCIVVRSSPLLPLQYVFIKVATGDGFAVGAALRALQGFPIAFDGVRTIEGLNTDSTTDKVNFPFPYKQLPYKQLYRPSGEFAGLIVRRRREGVFMGKRHIGYLVLGQGFYAYGMAIFNELVDIIRIHPEPVAGAYLGRYNSEDFDYVQAKTRLAKESCAPRLFHVICHVVHRAAGSYKRPGPALSPEEMRLRVYNMISRGAKGIFYRCKHWAQTGNKADWEKLRLEIAEINTELKILRPLLEIGDTVSLARSSEPLVEASTILCGNKGVVVLLINHDHSPNWPKPLAELRSVERHKFMVTTIHDRFSVSVNFPDGIEVADFFEVGGSWEKTKFKVSDNVLSFYVNGIKTTRQFVITFKGYSLNVDDDGDGINDLEEARVMERLTLALNGSEIEPPQDSHDCPDIQIAEKQYSFGTVDPKLGRIIHQFKVLNVGQRPLTIKSVRAFSDIVRTSLPLNPIPPHSSDYVKVECLLKGPVGKIDEKIILVTDDPNEKEVELRIGGIVRKEVVFFPTRVDFGLVDGNRPYTQKVTVLDQVGTLRLRRVAASSDAIKLITKSVTIPYKEMVTVFEPFEKEQKGFEITLVLDSKSLKKPLEDTLVIKTNNPKYSEITIRICAQIMEEVEVSPRSFMFYSNEIKNTISQDVTLSSTSDKKLVVVEVRTDSPIVSAEVLALVAGRSYKITAKLSEPVPGHVYRGLVYVHINFDGSNRKLEIPYYGFTKNRRFHP